jgi:hypothetical protein
MALSETSDGLRDNILPQGELAARYRPHLRRWLLKLTDQSLWGRLVEQLGRLRVMLTLGKERPVRQPLVSSRRLCLSEVSPLHPLRVFSVPEKQEVRLSSHMILPCLRPSGDSHIGNFGF